jgi:tetratricopeptide (TPR) repeat protein
VKTDHDKAAVESAKADAYLMLGQLDDAVAAYEAALEYAPYLIKLYLPLTASYLEKKSYDKHDWLLLLDVMERAASRWQSSKKWPKAVVQDIEESWLRAAHDDPLADDQSQSQSQSPPSHVYWAMFNAAHAAGDDELAWKRLERGHELDAELMRSGGGPSLSDAEARAQQELDAIKTLYREGFWMDGLGHASKVPVFIVGMLRSGSTLLETMLDAHADVVGLGEHSYFSFHQGTFGRELLEQGGKGAPDDHENVADDLQEVIEKHGKIVLDKIKASAAAVQASAPQGSGRVREAKRIIDKMLFNYKSIGMIHMMYPRAVIIHIMRDPLDTMYSCYAHKFDDSGASWATDPERLALEYAMYLEVMQHYRDVLPGRVIDVHYEELVARPEATMRQVLRAMDLGWDPAVLDFQLSNRTVQTHSMQQVRQGIYTTAIGGWRRHASGMKAIKEGYTNRLPHLASIHALPYADRINWAGDASFDYEGSLSALVDGSMGTLPVQRGASSGLPLEVGISGDATAMNGNGNAPSASTKKKKKKSKKKKSSKG